MDIAIRPREDVQQHTHEATLQSLQLPNPQSCMTFCDTPWARAPNRAAIAVGGSRMGAGNLSLVYQEEGKMSICSSINVGSGGLTSMAYLKPQGTDKSIVGAGTLMGAIVTAEVGLVEGDGHDKSVPALRFISSPIVCDTAVTGIDMRSTSVTEFCCCSDGGSIIVWDAVSESRTFSAVDRSSLAAAKFQGSQRPEVVTAGASSSSQLKVWDTRAGTTLPVWQGRDPTEGVRYNCVSVNDSKSNWIAAGTSAGSIALWDLRKSTILDSVVSESGGQREILKAKWSPHERFNIVSCAVDGTVEYWSVQQRAQMNKSYYIEFRGRLWQEGAMTMASAADLDCGKQGKIASVYDDGLLLLRSYSNNY
eukprot:g2441.t1